MKLKYKLEINLVADQYIALAVGEDAKIYKNIIFVNKVGEFILKCLQNETNRNSIVENTLHTFDGDEEVIKKEIDIFLYKLNQLNLLVGYE